MDARTRRQVIGPGQGATVWLGGCGVVLKVSGEETGGAFSIVEHPVLPGTLIPPHVHYDEDELSFVVEGTFGVKIGDRLLEAGAGSYVFKPKGIPHTFWNASAETARLVEVIWPSGFERFFKELGAAFQQAGGPPGPEMIRGLSDRYHCPYLMDWVPELQARYGVSVLHGGGQRPGENVPPER